jgi:hypothetical protein
MNSTSRIRTGALALVVVTALLLGSCTKKEAVKQDYSAGSWILNTTVAVASAVLGVSTYGDDDTTDCNWGSNSLNPIAVVNTYPTPMTFSITINTELAGNLNFFTASNNGGSSAGITGCTLSSQYAGTQTVTVPAAGSSPSFTVVGWIAAGGGQFSTNTGSHNVAIGAGGQQWYDFWLHQNGLTGGYDNLELNYSNTGGTDAAQNVQTGLFNGLDCSANSAGNVSLTSPNQLTTPFTKDNANAWTFYMNQPLCFGFLQPNSASQS